MRFMVEILITTQRGGEVHRSTQMQEKYRGEGIVCKKMHD